MSQLLPCGHMTRLKQQDAQFQVPSRWSCDHLHEEEGRLRSKTQSQSSDSDRNAWWETTRFRMWWSLYSPLPPRHLTLTDFWHFCNRPFLKSNDLTEENPLEQRHLQRHPQRFHTTNKEAEPRLVYFSTDFKGAFHTVFIQSPTYEGSSIFIEHIEIYTVFI